MEKKECPGCAVEVDTDEDLCPICGYEFPNQPLHYQIAAWIMIILLLLYWVVF